MSLYLNNAKISKIYVGNDKINKIFFGNSLIYNTSDLHTNEYFYFEAVENYGTAWVGFYLYRSNETITESAYTGWTRPNFEYSYDKTTWYSYTLGTTINIRFDENKRVYFRGNNTASWRGSGSGYGILQLQVIKPNTKIRCGGNIMSLRYKNFTGQLTLPCTYAFARLFNGCSNLLSAPVLPATTLTDYCYEDMFYDCIGLMTMPTLPAQTMKQYCYSHMFGGCTALKYISALPATTLADYCYYNMFGNCHSLTTAPVLPAQTMKPYCYSHMFGGCNSLITAPALPATTLADRCYYSMFANCTSLKNPPSILPASKAIWDCYEAMFSSCLSLEKVPKIMATSCDYTNFCEGMFYNTSITASATATEINKYAYRIPYTGTFSNSNYKFTNTFEEFTFYANTTIYISVPTAT